jgi:DnaJ-class molecular chaperone
MARCATCPTCGGAGFFGNGPYVEFCAYCHGTGEIIDETEWLEPDRKPVERERRKIPGNLKIASGDHAESV